MNKEELDEINELNLDLADVDELNMGLEIISYKAIKTIQELVDTILNLQSQLTQANSKIEKIKDFLLDKFRLWENECQEDENIVDEDLWLYKVITGKDYEEGQQEELLSIIGEE